VSRCDNGCSPNDYAHMDEAGVVERTRTNKNGATALYPGASRVRV
jgi:hypothetical protein